MTSGERWTGRVEREEGREGMGEGGGGGDD